MTDDNRLVRIALAEQGYSLEQLCNDYSWSVRVAVVEQGYGLEQLVNDEDYDVRIAVAEQGYGLEQLVNDEYYGVRETVAEQGYGLDILINDGDEDVCLAAFDALYRTVEPTLELSQDIQTEETFDKQNDISPDDSLADDVLSSNETPNTSTTDAQNFDSRDDFEDR